MEAGFFVHLKIYIYIHREAVQYLTYPADNKRGTRFLNRTTTRLIDLLKKKTSSKLANCIVRSNGTVRILALRKNINKKVCSFGRAAHTKIEKKKRELSQGMDSGKSQAKKKKEKETV